MTKVRTWVGLDVHAAKVVACVVDAEYSRHGSTMSLSTGRQPAAQHPVAPSLARGHPGSRSSSLAATWIKATNSCWLQPAMFWAAAPIPRPGNWRSNERNH
jgi:hypothetical protein